MKYRAYFLSRLASGCGTANTEIIEAPNMVEAALQAQSLTEQYDRRPMPYMLRGGISRRRFEAGDHLAGPNQIVRPWLLVSVTLNPEPPLNGPLPDEES